MALDRGPTKLTALPDIGRRVAFRAHGALRLIDRVHAALQDIEGAIDKRQFGMAVHQARYVALVCLSVRSLQREGEIELDDDSVSFDFFAGLSGEEVEAGLALVNAALEIDDSQAAAWLDRLHSYVHATERLLGYDEKLPALRSPNGAFGLIGLLRRWEPILEALSLPALLPSDWADASATTKREQEPAEMEHAKSLSEAVRKAAP